MWTGAHSCAPVMYLITELFQPSRKFLCSYPFSTSHLCTHKTPRKSETPWSSQHLGALACQLSWINHLVWCCMSPLACLFVTQHSSLKFHPGYCQVAWLIFIAMWRSLYDFTTVCLSLLLVMDACFQFWGSMTKAAILSLNTGSMWMCFLLSQAIYIGPYGLVESQGRCLFKVPGVSQFSAMLVSLYRLIRYSWENKGGCNHSPVHFHHLLSRCWEGSAGWG